MTTLPSPPSGVALPFSAIIAENPSGSASAVAITGTWEQRPLGLSDFDVALSRPPSPEAGFGTVVSTIDATDYDTAGPSFTRILSFRPTQGPLQLDGFITLRGGTPQPGSALTLTARSAQVPSRYGALTLDTVDEPLTYSDPAELVRVEVLTWEQWYILIDRDGSQPEGGS